VSDGQSNDDANASLQKTDQGAKPTSKEEELEQQLLALQQQLQQYQQQHSTSSSSSSAATVIANPTAPIALSTHALNEMRWRAKIDSEMGRAFTAGVVKFSGKSADWNHYQQRVREPDEHPGSDVHHG
jgi:type II secretory pathway pseudopilin PulG